MTDGLAAVLFDMDGLLVDTEPLWFETETEVMARLGAPWTWRTRRRCSAAPWSSTVGYLLARATRPAPPATVERWMIEGVLARGRGPGHGPPGRARAARRGGRRRHAVRPGDRPRSGVFAEAVLDATGFTFPVTVSPAMTSPRSKPDPEPYLLAAKLLDVDPVRCVALEDSPNGVASATAAGCRVRGGAVAGADPARAPARVVVRVASRGQPRRTPPDRRLTLSLAAYASRAFRALCPM